MEKNFDLNVAHIPKELKLIFEIVNREDVDSFKAIVKESFNNIDWDLFIDLAMHHRIYPLLSPKFKKIAVDFVSVLCHSKLLNRLIKRIRFACFTLPCNGAGM